MRASLLPPSPARAPATSACPITPLVLAVVVLVVVGLGACVAPLDRTVPRRAFRDSRAALDRAAQRAAPVRAAPLAVGWGEAEIVPPAGVSLAGYGTRAGDPHTSVHDPLHARALALRTDGAPVVFLALDLLLVDRGLAASIHERVRDVVEDGRLVLTASHTHGGIGGYAPGLVYSLVLGGFDARAEAALLDAIEAAVRGAIAALEPGRVVLGEVAAPGLGTNRVRKSGVPVDPVAGVLLAERARDGARAVLVTYAAHATTVSDLDRAVTADYPGVLAAQLRGAPGVAWAAFAAGAVGSMSPRAGWSEHPGATWTGAALATAVAGALPQLAGGLAAQVPLSVVTTTLVLPEAQWRLGDTWAVPSLFASWFTPATAPLTAVSLGRATWVSLPLELSGEIAARIRGRARGTGRTLVLSSFGGEYAGYVVPREAYDLPEEEKGEMADYETHLMSFYGPHMGDLAAAAAWRTMRAAEDRIEGPRPAATAVVAMPAPATPPPPEPARPGE